MKTNRLRGALTPTSFFALVVCALNFNSSFASPGYSSDFVQLVPEKKVYSGVLDGQVSRAVFTNTLSQGTCSSPRSIPITTWECSYPVDVSSCPVPNACGGILGRRVCRPTTRSISAPEYYSCTRSNPTQTGETPTYRVNTSYELTLLGDTSALTGAERLQIEVANGTDWKSATGDFKVQLLAGGKENIFLQKYLTQENIGTDQERNYVVKVGYDVFSAEVLKSQINKVVSVQLAGKSALVKLLQPLDPKQWDVSFQVIGNHGWRRGTNSPIITVNKNLGSIVNQTESGPVTQFQLNLSSAMVRVKRGDQIQLKLTWVGYKTGGSGLNGLYDKSLEALVENLFKFQFEKML